MLEKGRLPTLREIGLFRKYSITMVISFVSLGPRLGCLGLPSLRLGRKWFWVEGQGSHANSEFAQPADMVADEPVPLFFVQHRLASFLVRLPGF
jgi:hypothetical protein